MQKVQMYLSDVSSAPLPRNFMLQGTQRDAYFKKKETFFLIHRMYVITAVQIQALHTATYKQ